MAPGLSARCTRITDKTAVEEKTLRERRREWALDLLYCRPPILSGAVTEVVKVNLTVLYKIQHILYIGLYISVTLYIVINTVLLGKFSTFLNEKIIQNYTLYFSQFAPIRPKFYQDFS